MKSRGVDVRSRRLSPAEQLVEGPPQLTWMSLVGVNSLGPVRRPFSTENIEVIAALGAPAAAVVEEAADSGPSRRMIRSRERIACFALRPDVQHGLTCVDNVTNGLQNRSLKHFCIGDMNEPTAYHGFYGSTSCCISHWPK